MNTSRMGPSGGQGAWRSAQMVGLWSALVTALTLLDMTRGNEVVRLWAWDDRAWLAVTPAGTFDGSPEGIERLGFMHEQCVYPADEFMSLYRPETLLAQWRRPQAAGPRPQHP